MVYKVPPLRARRRERRRCGGAIGCVLLLSIIFWILHCCADCQASIAKFLTRLPDSRHKGMASSADLEIQCLADAAAYIERHGWPRSRLEGWRCAPVPRVSNPAHWDPYATVSPPSRHRRDSRIAGTGSARTRKSRGAPSLSSRWSRTVCSARPVRRCGACLGHCRVKRRRTPSRTTGVVHRIPGTRPSPIVTPCVEINQCRSRRGDSGRTRRKILISTQVTPLRRTRARRSSP
jgi:hypothetical protein